MAAYVRMLFTSYPTYAGSTGVDPRGMIGWRGFAATTLPFLGSSASLLFIGTFSLLSLAVLPAIWRGPWNAGSPRFARQLAATVAITLLVAYHSQPHGAALMIVPGAFVAAQADSSAVVRRLLTAFAVGGPVVGFVSAVALGNLWMIGPATTLALTAIVVALVRTDQYDGSDHQTPTTASLPRVPGNIRTSESGSDVNRSRLYYQDWQG